MRRQTAIGLAAAAGLALATSNGLSQDRPIPGMENPQTFKTRITRNIGAQYLLFLPRDYQARGAKRWPLIFFLHGAGERGTNVWLVAKHGPPKIVKEKPDFPFIVVSPQCPEGQTWSNDALLALLEHVTRKYKVDEGRIYLTGLSMGGFGTWSLGLERPEKFAAIAPICGGGDTLKILLPDATRARALKTLPVWVFHGAKDPVVNPDESKRMVEALKKIGNDVKFTVYPDAGHDSWTEAYNNPALYDWFLDHQRRPRREK
ncbi:MAG: carboxylesterase family protein [Limisphaerales bacterium]